MKPETHNTETELFGTCDPASAAPLAARKAWMAPYVITSEMIDQETEFGVAIASDITFPGS